MIILHCAYYALQSKIVRERGSTIFAIGVGDVDLRQVCTYS